MHSSELPEWSRSDARVPLRPPAQDSAARASDTDQAAPVTPGGPMNASAVLALQRTAGNAAVTRALGAQRHVHGAGCGHGLPVQRVSLANDQREFGPGKLKQVDPKDQANLEKSFPKKDGAFKQFPDPTSFSYSLMGPLTQRLNKVDPKGPLASSGGAADWVQGINSRRDEDGGAYRRNCIEAARSFLASWSGNPTAAAGIHDESGVETGGNDLTKRWLGTNWRTSEAGADENAQGVWGAVASRLKGAGHGASCIVVFEREETHLVHAVNGVNHKGDIVWVDAQMGRVSKTPMYKGSLFMTITLDPQFAPVEPPASQAPQALTGATLEEMSLPDIT
ncbi:toxin glutamine deamidase domain-containing protein [Streptomyces odontomachi]|uniref:toxin glutamine deamidase domain-containing protein n=1 Tax=Streptomyces odontomachi TaxID=2944940 RepID=UPI00210DF8B6|nr:toxin glutamine deamidase domain-containing protein [Streptomyces sp. ODS25]